MLDGATARISELPAVLDNAQLPSAARPAASASASADRGAHRDALESRFGFPEITLAEFKTLPRFARQEILLKNRILTTDTYNRTMSELASVREPAVDPDTGVRTPLDRAPGVFTLQFRRAPEGYMVMAGLHDAIDAITAIRISEAELRFAREYYADARVPFFNDALWTEVVERYGGRLPLDIDGVREGSVVLPGEPVLTVRGPSELAAHFEAEFHRIFFPTAVATRAHRILRIIEDPARYLEVGKRGAPKEDVHLATLRAMEVGGGFNRTSNDLGIGLHGMIDIGTMGHRYVQSFRTVEAAFRHAIERLPMVVLLPDLVESYQGIDLSLRLKKEYRANGKPIWVRLDSGDILEQTRYYLRRTEELGFTDPRRDTLVVEGIESIEEIAAIEAMIRREFGDEARKRVVYAAGGLLASVQTTRADYSSGYKQAAFMDESGVLEPTMKFSSSPGKRSYPGAPRLVVHNGARVVAQHGERLWGRVDELFAPLVRGGKKVFEEESVEAISRRRESEFEAIFGSGDPSPVRFDELRAKPSPKTTELIAEVCGRYGLEA